LKITSSSIVFGQMELKISPSGAALCRSVVMFFAPDSDGMERKMQNTPTMAPDKFSDLCDFVRNFRHPGDHPLQDMPRSPGWGRPTPCAHSPTDFPKHQQQHSNIAYTEILAPAAPALLFPQLGCIMFCIFGRSATSENLTGGTFGILRKCRSTSSLSRNERHNCSTVPCCTAAQCYGRTPWCRAAV
jgi:hypothetical protein